MGYLDNVDVPTEAELNQTRRVFQKGEKPGEQSRLQAKKAKALDEGKEERRWKAEVWKRDGGQCRWCKRKVRKCLDLVPDRGECHHVSGREVRAIRWDARNGLLLDAACHERLTGKVNEKFVLVPTKVFVVDGVEYADASFAVRFKRVAGSSPSPQEPR